MNDIRQIATSFNGSRVAFGSFEKDVQIIDIETKEIVSQFPTVLDYGGKRLAIHENGEICIAGCWAIHGIEAYRVHDGSVLWQRKDLKKLQRFCPLFSRPDSIFAEFEGGSSCVLDARNGRVLKRMPRIKSLFESPYSSIDLLEKPKSFEIVDRNTRKSICRIERQSFGTLGVAFGPDSVCVSESGRPMRCYDISKEQLKWSVASEVKEHALQVSYNRNINRYAGVFWSYQRSGDHVLKIVHPDSGNVEQSVPLGGLLETSFAKHGEILIVSERTKAKSYHVESGKFELLIELPN